MKSNFSEKEKNLLSELRKSVGELLEDDFERADDFLITWIRYANYDVKKADAALRNNKKWRREKNMDNILLEDMKDAHAVLPVEWEPVFDKTNCPVPFNWDIKTVVNGSPDGKDLFVRYVMKYCEHIMKILRRQYFQTDGRVTTFSFIIDMDGFCYRQLLSRRVISGLTEVVRTAEENFPGVIKAVYVTNVPKAFKILFNVVKPFLSGDTISRIKLFDSNKEKWTEALLQDIAQDQLPKFLVQSCPKLSDSLPY